MKNCLFWALDAALCTHFFQPTSFTQPLTRHFINDKTLHAHDDDDDDELTNRKNIYSWHTTKMKRKKGISLCVTRCKEDLLWKNFITHHLNWIYPRRRVCIFFHSSLYLTLFIQRTNSNKKNLGDFRLQVFKNEIKKESHSVKYFFGLKSRSSSVIPFNAFMSSFFSFFSSFSLYYYYNIAECAWHREVHGLFVCNSDVIPIISWWVYFLEGKAKCLLRLFSHSFSTSFFFVS